jgi:hypothetical protein
MNLNYYQNIMDEYFFTNIKQCTNNINDIDIINKHISEISSNITNVTDTISEKKQSDINTKLSETDETYFYKPWNKMTTVHKIIKMKQYVNDMDISSNQKHHLIDFLKVSINKKKIIKNDQVIYDISRAKIVSIPKLEIKKNNTFLIG